MRSAALERVPFYGDTLEAQSVDGRVSAKPWAVITMIVTTAADARGPKLLVLPGGKGKQGELFGGPS